jgi:hypothetical protein
LLNSWNRKEHLKKWLASNLQAYNSKVAFFLKKKSVSGLEVCLRGQFKGYLYAIYLQHRFNSSTQQFFFSPALTSVCTYSNYFCVQLISSHHILRISHLQKHGSSASFSYTIHHCCCQVRVPSRHMQLEKQLQYQ